MLCLPKSESSPRYLKVCARADAGRAYPIAMWGRTLGAGPGHGPGHGPCGLPLLLLVLALLPTGGLAGYLLGVGIADVTGPTAEVHFVSILLRHSAGF